MKGRPTPAEYASFYEPYVAQVPEDDVLGALREQLDDTLRLLAGISEDESLVRHPPYTWSTREVVGHLIDTERVFGYRALRFARGDATALPGFDEGLYARNSGADRTPLAELAEEFAALRKSHVQLFKHLDEEAWSRGGEANRNPVTVRALAYLIVGHVRHHAAILRKRFSGAN